MFLLLLLVLNDSQWSVGFVLDSTTLGNNDYQQKLMDELKRGRQQLSEMFVSVRQDNQLVMKDEVRNI